MIVHDDPYHWFREVPGSAEVRVPETEQKGLLLNQVSEVRLRELRDNLDRGQLPDSEVVVRNKTEFEQTWPAIAARVQFEKTPTPREHYQELASAIDLVEADVLFEDIDRLKTTIEEIEKQSPEQTANCLRLLIRERTGEAVVPSPELLRTHQEFVAELLDLERPVDQTDVVAPFFDMPEVIDVLRSPDNTRDPAIVSWLQKLEWVRRTDDNDLRLTEVGECVRQYATGTDPERREFEIAALLEHAKSAVTHLVANKIEKVQSHMEVSLPSDANNTTAAFMNVLLSRADEETYCRARQLLAEEGGDMLSRVNVEDTDTVRKAITNADKVALAEIKETLGYIPVELFVDDPPSELDPIIAPLEPDTLRVDFDTAIANNRELVGDTIDEIEALLERLQPLLPEDDYANTQAVISEARDMHASLVVDKPTSATECYKLYRTLIEKQEALDFDFAQSERQLETEILEACETFIRDSYRRWAHEEDKATREVTLLTDLPEFVADRLEVYDHVIVMISDGFGLRQWTRGSYNLDRVERWKQAEALENELTATVFPSETGAGHYSFLTGSFPEEHGRDDIRKSAQVDDDTLFHYAKEKGAHTKALSYLPGNGSGFSSVLKALADEFDMVEALESNSGALTKESRQRVGSHLNAHEKTVTVIQHNQIDQIHDVGEHIAGVLYQSVAEEILDYIEGLAAATDVSACFMLTADHGMLEVGDDDRVNIYSSQIQNELHNRNVDVEDAGQRVAGLTETGGKSHGFGSIKDETERYEILDERQMRELRALTDDKCDGPCLRFKKRYYSENSDMSATHGSFTFDEMFIPLLTFDLPEIGNLR